MSLGIRTMLLKAVLISFLGMTIQGCSSEEAPQGKKSKVSTEKSKGPQDAYQPNKFKLVKWTTDRSPGVPKVDFSLEPKSDTCTYTAKVNKFFKQLSNTALKRSTLSPQWSPIRILENDQPLQPNVAKEKFSGPDCIGASYSVGDTVFYSPTSEAVKADSLKLALDTSIPIETEDGPVYWLYGGVGYGFRLLKGKIGTDENVTLKMSVAYSGKLTRKPRIFIQKKGYTFEESGPGMLTLEIPLANVGGKFPVRIRTFNLSRINELSISSKNTTVYLVEPPKSK